MKSKSFPRVFVAVMVAVALMAAMLPVAMAEGSAPSAGADAGLSGIALSSGTLSPAFDAGTTAYTVALQPQVGSLTLTPQLSDPAASMTIDGLSVPGLRVDVAPGQARPVAVEVTAQDGVTKKIYTVSVTRNAPPHGRLAGIGVSAGALSPSFLPSTWKYGLRLDENTSSVTITPEKGYASDTVKINGKPVSSVTVNIAKKGQSRNVVVTVKSTAGRKYSGTYLIRVTRAKSGDASLKALRTSPSGLVSSFDPATLSYSVSTPYNKQVVLVQPVVAVKGARVWIDGKRASARAFRLTPGVAKAVSIRVVAPDGKSTKTYTLTLTRSLPSAGDALKQKVHSR